MKKLHGQTGKNEQVLPQQDQEATAEAGTVSANSSKMARLLALRIVYGNKIPTQDHIAQLAA
eukprot:474637-Amphidinium_carterae.1